MHLTMSSVRPLVNCILIGKFWRNPKLHMDFRHSEWGWGKLIASNPVLFQGSAWKLPQALSISKMGNLM